MTYKEKFTKFLQDTNKEEISNNIVTKEEWLNSLDILYDNIESCLSGYQREGLLDYVYENINLTENYIGSYTTKVLHIRFGKYHYKIEPIGANIMIGINILGKVKISGDLGDDFFILCREDNKLKWKVRTTPPNIRYYNLDEEIFYSILLEGCLEL